jgi:hypothetical protein
MAEVLEDLRLQRRDAAVIDLDGNFHATSSRRSLPGHLDPS